MPEIVNLAYLELKAAQRLFGKPLTELDEPERAKVRAMADRQYGLESRVLKSQEARDVCIPHASLEDAMTEIRKRYPEEEEFVADLARNGLDPAGYLEALERELKVEAILEKVGARATQVSEIDVELYWQYHPEQFRSPQTRRARHILVTINPNLAENSEEAAAARIGAIAARLVKDPKRFEEQALKHSECPTALQGGLLGDMPQGKLYPELDAALFAMHPGQISDVLVSPLGFHLLLCVSVQAERVLGMEQSRATIRNMLERRRKRICQQAWLKQIA